MQEIEFKTLYTYKGDEKGFVELCKKYIINKLSILNKKSCVIDEIINQAWEEGHSSGYSEVAIKIDNYIEFIDRVLKEFLK